jgi:microcystin-dependent protein
MAEPFIGEIRMFGFNFAPRDWANCDGQLMSIAENTALFALLGTIYGGDGMTSFALPDLRGRFPMHVGQGAGLPIYVMGQKAGAEQVTLSVAQMPSHSHALTGTVASTEIRAYNADDADQADPEGRVLGSSGEDIYSDGPPDTTMHAEAAQTTVTGTATDPAGGSSAVSIRNPFLTIRFCIALVGLFPSRS